MDVIFDWCVAVLVYFADVFGITYKEINVWVFVIIWPIVTLALITLIFYQLHWAIGQHLFLNL